MVVYLLAVALLWAEAFYSGLFGWTFQDLPTDSGTVYSMAQLEGYNVAGLGPLDPGVQEQGISPFWSSYVKHDDVDAIAARAVDAGGNIIVPPTPAGNVGEYLVAQDPQDAAFNIIEYAGTASPPPGYE